MFVQIKHHPHRLLPRVDVSIQQLHQPLLLLERRQHLAQPSGILLTAHALVRDQIRDTLNINRMNLRLALRHRPRPQLHHFGTDLGDIVEAAEGRIAAR